LLPPSAKETPVKYDQSKTPYLDALIRYRERGFTPFHTPGHKRGKGAPPKLIEALGRQLLDVDVAMAGGVEDTRESTGLVQLAEEMAAEAWGAEQAWFLVNGSTSGLHALVMTTAGPGEHIILPRNSHKSVLAALIFSGAMPHYVEPTIEEQWQIPLGVPNSRVARALKQLPQAKALVVTSPNYYGVCADLPRVADVVHAAGIPFIVDQAWGPHLRFCRHLPVDAMTAGADAAVASVHKLISGLTQSSILLARGTHINLKRLASIVKMTQSTSPQVLMLVSIDAARCQMATNGERLWHTAIELAEWAREQINTISGVRCLTRDVLQHEGAYAFDPTRLTITARDLGLSGYELETVLRDDYGIAVEMAEPLNIVNNVTYGDSRADVKRLVGALRDLAARYADRGMSETLQHARMLAMPRFTRQVMTPRDAFFAPSVALPTEECAGHIAAEIVTPYPPGVPVLGPGEEISTEIVAYLREGAAIGLHVHGPEDTSLRTLRVVR